MSAKKFAQKALAKSTTKMQDYKDLHRCEDRITLFIKEACALVVECRHVLKWTYPLGYYLKDGDQKALYADRFCPLYLFLYLSRYEFLQRDLEENTEQLTQLTELEAVDMNRLAIMNMVAETKNVYFLFSTIVIPFSSFSILKV